MVARRELWGSTNARHRHARTCQLGHLLLLVLLASQVAALLPCGLHVALVRLPPAGGQRTRAPLHSLVPRQPRSAAANARERVGGGGGLNAAEGVKRENSARALSSTLVVKYNWRSVQPGPIDPQIANAQLGGALAPQRLNLQLRPERGRIAQRQAGYLEVGRDVKL